MQFESSTLDNVCHESDLDEKANTVITTNFQEETARKLFEQVEQVFLNKGFNKGPQFWKNQVMDTP